MSRDFGRFRQPFLHGSEDELPVQGELTNATPVPVIKWFSGSSTLVRGLRKTEINITMEHWAYTFAHRYE